MPELSLLFTFLPGPPSTFIAERSLYSRFSLFFYIFSPLLLRPVFPYTEHWLSLHLHLLSCLFICLFNSSPYIKAKFGNQSPVLWPLFSLVCWLSLSGLTRATIPWITLGHRPEQKRMKSPCVPLAAILASWLCAKFRMLICKQQAGCAWQVAVSECSSSCYSILSANYAYVTCWTF